MVPVLNRQTFLVFCLQFVVREPARRGVCNGVWSVTGGTVRKQRGCLSVSGGTVARKNDSEQVSENSQRDGNGV